MTASTFRIVFVSQSSLMLLIRLPPRCLQATYIELAAKWPDRNARNSPYLEVIRMCTVSNKATVCRQLLSMAVPRRVLTAELESPTTRVNCAVRYKSLGNNLGYFASEPSPDTWAESKRARLFGIPNKD
jgi:hypothetical protein